MARRSPHPWSSSGETSGALVGIAGITLLLSLAGVSSIVSLAVSQRTREIGVRVALGAGVIACWVPAHRALKIEPV